MKKIWKILGVVALVAGLTPYRVEHNEFSDEKTYKALLWKVTDQPHPEQEGRRKYTLRVGFQNPMDHTMEDAALFADELLTGTDSSKDADPSETPVY